MAKRLRVLEESMGGADPTLRIALLVAVGATAVILGAALVVTWRSDRQAEEKPSDPALPKT